MIINTKLVNEKLKINKFSYQTAYRAEIIRGGMETFSYLKIFYLNEHVADFDYVQNLNREILTIYTKKEDIIKEIKAKVPLFKKISES